MRGAAAAVLAATAALSACSSDAADPEPSAAASTSSSPARSSSTAPTTERSPTPSSAAATAGPELVAAVTARVFEENADALSAELVKSNSLIEAQEEFRFDKASRTLVLSVTSVFKTGRPDVAYSLATDLAPIFWGPEATASASPEALVLFSVTVDAVTWVCDGAAMAALADRELSQESFVQRCGSTP